MSGGCQGVGKWDLNRGATPGAPKDAGFQFSYETANLRAQQLMKDSFFWDVGEEAAPFGSDDGWDAAQRFHAWRLTEKSGDPVAFVNRLRAEWNYPALDWTVSDSVRIKAILDSSTVLDEAIISERVKLLKQAVANSADEKIRNSSEADLRKVVLENSKGDIGMFLLYTDNAIIGVAFAQLVEEGIVEANLKKLTIIALKRQLLPVLINRYDEPVKERRRSQLTRMLSVMEQAVS